MGKQKRLGELLCDAGLINEAQLQGALERQKKWGGRFGENLILNNAITEEQLLRFFAARTGIEELDISGIQILPHIIKKVPGKLAEKHHIMPVAMKDKNTLMVAVSDPMDFEAMDQVRFTTGLRVDPVLSSYSAIAESIDKFYHDGRGVYQGSKPRNLGNSPRMVKGELMEKHGGHSAEEDPDLIIFGNTSNEKPKPKSVELVDISANYKPREDTGEFDDGYPELDRTVPDISMPAMPMPSVPMGLGNDQANPAPQPQPLQQQPLQAVTAPTAPAAQPRPAGQARGKTGISTEEKFRALYNVLVRKGLITEQEMKAELIRIRSAKSKST